MVLQRAGRGDMSPLTIGVIAVTVVCLLIFAALTLAGVVGADGSRKW